VPFTLFCGYPHAPFVPASPTAVRRVCECHTSVVGHVPPAIAVHARRAFAPTLDSTAAARRFARTTFREWGRVDLADDAAGIVAELATNAVLHARSDYTVDLGFDGHTGRVEVRDTNPRMLHSVARGRFAEDGRGLILVAGLASDWGVTALPDGKVVWAQLGGD
jgi:anti-sigma regulatory factor (Ser/Thr protein kinase)